MNVKRYIVGATVVIIGVLIWRTDTFQREFFPKRFWQKQVRVSEEMVEGVEFTVRDFAIELQKKQMTAALDIKQQTNTMVFAGMSHEEARELAVKEIRTEIDALKETIRIQKEILSEERKRLREAKRELSKYR